MTRYLLSDAVVGTAADLPHASDPLAGASSVPTALYIESDTGVIRLSTGAGWVVVGQMTVGTLPLGVTSDGASGIVVAGELTANDSKFQTKAGGGLFLGKSDDTNYALDINLSTGSSGTEVQMRNPDLGTVFVINAAGGVGIFGIDAPAAQPVLATGAGHTVDSVITLLQSYGLCKQS